MTTVFARHVLSPATFVALGIAAISPAAAQFATPVQLVNDTADLGAMAVPSAGPEDLVVWSSQSSSQYYYSTRTAENWASPAPIANAFAAPGCCEGLYPYGAGNAAFVFSNPGGTYGSEYVAGSGFTTPAPVPSTPPYFQNGFIFVMNANGDAAVVSKGNDMRVVRRASGSTSWGSVETIPTPTLPPDSAATIGSAAIGGNGELVVSFNVAKTGCITKCGLTLYAATEAQSGSGWKLSKKLSLHAAGYILVSQPFVDPTGHAGVAYVQQFGQTLELNAAIQLKPTAGWRGPVTITSQPYKIGRKHSTLTLFGTETDASGKASIVFGSGVLGIPGQNVWTVDGNARKNTWGSPVSLATGVAVNGLHFANSTVGGIALAWDNPDAPIGVLARAATASAWGSVQTVGNPNCGSGAVVCTRVLSLSIADSGQQRILYSDMTNNPGSLFYSETP